MWLLSFFDNLMRLVSFNVMNTVPVCLLEQNISIPAYFGIPFRNYLLYSPRLSACIELMTRLLNGPASRCLPTKDLAHSLDGPDLSHRPLPNDLYYTKAEG